MNSLGFGPWKSVSMHSQFRMIVAIFAQVRLKAGHTGHASAYSVFSP